MVTAMVRWKSYHVWTLHKSMSRTGEDFFDILMIILSLISLKNWSESYIVFEMGIGLVGIVCPSISCFFFDIGCKKKQLGHITTCEQVFNV